MNKQKNRGFTLIELIAIIVVLAAIFLVAFPILLGTTKKTKTSAYEVTVENLCEAGKAYIADNQDKYPGATTVGNKITLPLLDLLEYGVVTVDMVDPQLNISLDDSTLIYTVQDDQSLKCEFEEKTTVTIPSDAYCNENLVYTGELQSLLKRRIPGVIYTNDTAVNAGTYTVTALLDDESGYMWDDTTKTAKTFTCSIAKADDNITIVPVSVVYSNTPINPDITAKSGISTNKTFYSDDQCNTVTNNIKNVGTYYVIATTNGNTNYNSVNSGCKIAGTVIPAPLVPTITCQNKIYDGTRNATCTATVATVMQGDSLTANPGTCLFDTADVGTNKTVTCTGITATGTGRSNYNLDPTTANTVATINNVKLSFSTEIGTLSGSSIVYTRKGVSGAYTGITNSTSTSYPTVSETGYTFNGWYIGSTKVINPDGSLVPNISGITDSNGKWLITTDQTFKSGITANTYTVRYNGNGNTGGSTANSSHTYNVAKNLTTNGFTRTGYTFQGWATTSTGSVTYSNGQSVKNLTSVANGIVDLYAVWTANTYTVRYNGNGNTGGSTANSSHTYNVAKNLTTNGFTKTGYTFAGWATTSTGSVAYSNGQSVTNLTPTAGGTVDLFAKWAANTYTVRYIGNGNTGGGTANSSHTYDVAKNLTTNGFTKTGYTFAGWATTSTGSAVYSNGQSVTNLTSTAGGTVDLFAKWSVDSYSITYNLDGGTNGSGNPSSYTIETNTITLSAPSKTGFSFLGWTGSNGTTPQTTVTIPKGSTGAKTYTANWQAAPTPSVTCSVSGTSATGTGGTNVAGYLVGATVTCTCNGNGVNPTSLVLTSGGTQVASASGNGTGSISKSYTISSPGSANIVGTCSNGTTATGQTGTKYYYRKFQIIFNQNGASSISSSGETQYLMANSTSGDGGHAFRSTIYRNTDCGSACGVVGWEWSSSTSTTARLNSGASIHLCWNGTSGCSYSVASDKNSGTLNVTGAFNLYAISYGTISGLPQTRSVSGSWAKAYYTTAANDPYVNTDNTSQVIVDSEASVRVFNTRRSAYAVTQGVCAWVWGGTQGAEGNFATLVRTGGADLIYTANGTSTNYGGTRGNNPPGFAAIPIGVYDNNNWWCQTNGGGWTLKLDPRGGTYNGTTGYTDKVMQYGSRVNNNIGVPTKTGSTFDGWYDALSGGTMIFNSSGQAVGNSANTYWAHADISPSYAIWTYHADYNDPTLYAYAHWTPIIYTITLNRNGGSGGTATIYFKYGVGYYIDMNATTYQMTTSSEPITRPTRTGYDFAGYAAPSGSLYIGANRYLTSSASVYAFTSNTTFTAQWSPKWTITLKMATDYAHQSAPTYTNSAYYGTSFNVSACNDSACTGWYTSSNSSGVKVFNKNGTPNTSATTYWSGGKWIYQGDVTLYAKYN